MHWRWHPVEPTLCVVHEASLAPSPVATESLYGVALTPYALGRR